MKKSLIGLLAGCVIAGAAFGTTFDNPLVTSPRAAFDIPPVLPPRAAFDIPPVLPPRNA